MTDNNFSAKQRKSFAAKGQALPDGSFPVRNADDLKDAIRLIGHAKNPAAAKAHIIKRARALGLMSMIPERWTVGK